MTYRNLYILGINRAHDSSVSLLKNGELIAAAEEERFTRVKHYWGFPGNALKYVLEEAGISVHEVEHFAFATRSPVKHYLALTERFICAGYYLRQPISTSLYDLARWAKFSFYDRLGVSLVSRQFGYKPKREQVHYVDHHLSHASSASRCSGFNQSLIMAIDLRGDGTSTLLGRLDGNSIEVLKRIKHPNSLGEMYRRFSQHLGFVWYGEGKAMGLAPYGIPKDDFDKVLSFDGLIYKVDDRFTFGSRSKEEREKHFGPARRPGEEITQRHRDLAATLQRALEIASVKLLRWLNEEADSDCLSLGGGVALNCKMNGVLLKTGLVDDVYVQPAANDSGTSLGAALEVYARLGYKSVFEMRHPYWGPQFSDEYVKAKLDRYKLNYEVYDDIGGVVAELLAKKKVVGWFQGRMEWGPRALGNRSILADPRDPKMRDIINKYVKRREMWRPLAPSILADAADEYLVGAYPSLFMNLAFQVVEKKKKEIPAVVHVDGSTRPQTVEKSTNPAYWRLIKSFEDITSVPVVLNTSFNDQGEPIVCTPDEALHCFLTTGMDCLAIGSFLLRKGDL